MCREDFERHLSEFANADTVALARLLPDRERQKFDEYVISELLDRANAADRLDFVTANESALMAIERLGQTVSG